MITEKIEITEKNKQMERLRIAVQKSGRLNEGSMKLLKECGIDVPNGNNQLKISVENFDAEILFLRDDDIPEYVQDGVADIGFVGENVVLEKNKETEIVERLGYGKCRLSIALPKGKQPNTISDLDGLKIATSYPFILQNWLNKNSLKAAIHEISGSVEIAPRIGLFIDAWEKFRKSKYSYTGLEGFLKTPYYLLHMVGPSNQNFNYSDGGSGLGIQPAMYWFAKNINDASIIWNDTKFIEKNATSKLNDERLLPALLVWAKDIHLQNTNPQSGLYWVGGGVNPVAMMRSSWIDPNALYLGFKTGTPSASHGHMDVGSFVLDADGLRWASDFGMQNYNSLESNGVDLWNMSQNSPRWSVFRYNNLAHNTLSFNNQHQVVKGKAEIGSYSTQPEFMNAIADISEVYAGQIQVAKRGVALIDGKYALVRDELKTLPKPTTVRWTLLTTAAVIISDTNTIVLTQGGKKMYLKIKSNNTFAIKSWSTTSPNSYDAPNPGTSLVGFESVLPADKTTQFDVFLIPEKNLADVNYTILSLAQWPKN